MDHDHSEGSSISFQRLSDQKSLYMQVNRKTIPDHFMSKISYPCWAQRETRSCVLSITVSTTKAIHIIQTQTSPLSFNRQQTVSIILYQDVASPSEVKGYLFIGILLQRQVLSVQEWTHGRFSFSSLSTAIHFLFWASLLKSTEQEDDYNQLSILHFVFCFNHHAIFQALFW